MYVRLNRPIGEVLEEVRRAADERGVVITLTGDETKGEFAGEGVAGHYVVRDGVVEITVTKKPWYVTNHYVETKLKELFR